jgi:hypothetical protein
MKKYFVEMDSVYNKPETIAKFYMFEDGANIVYIEPIKPDKISIDTIASLLFDGEYIYGKDGKQLSINIDGYEFLNNLKNQFSGSAIRCGDIKIEIV